MMLDEGWRFHELGSMTSHDADVPGTVHTDLMRHGMIPDPFVGMNVDSVQWVGERDWSYVLDFEVTPGLLEREHIDLVFDGLDTFAEVYLNDSLLGRANNMFRTWRYDVRRLLRSGTNTLQVVFRSPEKEGREALSAYGRSLPADNDQGAVKVSPFVRKAGYHFGWDFAPRLLTCGIWKPVRLHGWDRARIEGALVRQHHGKGGGAIHVDAIVWMTGEGPVQVQAWCDGARVATRTVFPDGRGPQTVPLSFELMDTARWWPAGSGARPMHQLRITAGDAAGEWSTWEGALGLVDVELDQRVDSIGEAFTFRVNGKPVFMKGCNLVPPDMFLPRAGDSTWVRLVRDMQRAHMNMVRVWGGGVYPPDAFFTACDTAGILVWQDLMFANTMVPGNDAFRSNVLAEVTDQVFRLAHHPSLAVWCGNNEVDVAWKNWGWQGSYSISQEDSLQMWNDYQQLFHWDLQGWLQDLDPEHAYVPTSPVSNWGSQAGLRNGDLHYWGVWHGDSAFSSFRNNVGRFVSEYGFQSWPDSALLARYLPASALWLGSPELARRQLSYKTDKAILAAIQHEFGENPTTLGRFIALSQQAQASAYHQAISAHLAAYPRCMGTLFWQLNDCWPGPSWSAVDYTGNWKPVMFSVQSAYGLNGMRDAP